MGDKSPKASQKKVTQKKVKAAAVKKPAQAAAKAKK